ncbi:class A beta-lactamase-related serine hydrolase [Salipiger pacificus]|nr:class A beta-lactamase-related serine hydrolase [Alloyangia pacifica]MCA0947935.1 class A beta-lactamase-related serine hydrolase [Alloyangia pacifica]
MKVFLGAALAAVVTVCLPGLAAAQEAERAVLKALLSGDTGNVEVTEEFARAVPEAQLDGLLETLQAQIGPVEEIELEGGSGILRSATYQVPVKITLDPAGRIAGLRLGAPEPLVADLRAAVAGLAGLGAEVSWLVTREGEVLAAGGAAHPLAVGSAFKLGILSVLARDVRAGKTDWDRVLRLGESHRSLPSGRLQDFPDEAPVTLHTAALLMIAESDNTATDLLLDLLGRDTVAEELEIAPEALLSTREFFALKSDPAAAQAWLDAEPQDRPAIAAEAALMPPDPAAAAARSVPGIEWYLPLERLCALLLPMAELPMLQLNPGPAYGLGPAAYKGGSEPGVLNFTVALRDAEERPLCAGLTVNDPGVIDEKAATGAFRALLRRALAQP